MQRAFHAGAVVCVKISDAFGDVINICACDLFIQQGQFVFNETRRRQAPQIDHDLEQSVTVVYFFHRVADIRGKHFEERFQIICNSMLSHRRYRD